MHGEAVEEGRCVVTKVLDKGFVDVIDVLGNDMTIVNSARVSFGKRKSEIDDKDIALLAYLVKHKHWSPFRHVMVQFHIKAPEFVMRQIFRHVVGIEATSTYPTKDTAWNELSGRYTKITDFYEPQEWRAQSEDNKQGSAGLVEDQEYASLIHEKVMTHIQLAYEDLLELGVAKEQARIILPLNMYTEVYWTASFQAIMNFLELRLDGHAQWEIREYAKKVEEITKKCFPEAMNAWWQR